MSSAIVEKIRSRGHWLVEIRPTDYRVRIDNVTRLFPLVREHAVELRGWDFPHIDTRNQPVIGEDWAGQEYEWEHYLESWRLYSSGQFVSIVCMPDDWRDQSSLWPPDKGWEFGSRWGIVETIYQATEVFEFASRLTLSEAGGDGVHVSLTAAGLEGRILWMEDPKRAFYHEYRTSVPDYRFDVVSATEELVANKRAIAVNAATEIIRRFGWDPPPQVVAEIQSGLERS